MAGDTLRVLNIQLDARLNGPSLRIANVAEGLRKHNIDTIVCVPRQENDIVQVLQEKRIAYVTVGLKRIRKTISVSTHISYVYSLVPSLRELGRIIRELSIDIIHSNGFLQLQGLIAGKIYNVPVVWHFNDVLLPSLITRRSRILSMQADICLFASREVGDRFGYKKLPDLNVMPAPVDTKLFDCYGKSDSIVEEFNLQNRVVIGTTANINKIKGLDNLIEAVRILRQKHPNIRCLITGSVLTTKRAYYESLVEKIRAYRLEKEVVFTGKRTDVRSILSALDVYVCASLSEACPISVLEAMSMKLPVVATNVGGIPEIIADGVNGILVEPRNPRELAEGVTRILRDKKSASSMGERARQRVVNKYDLDICVRKHKRVYRELEASTIKGK